MDKRKLCEIEAHNQSLTHMPRISVMAFGHSLTEIQTLRLISPPILLDNTCYYRFRLRV